ncbi:trap transporter, 4tm/12tm fusion protein [Citreicella sp. SE45]|nr:trap transporter, 4tm/12tm fusion protein [Citreicella sp. SE45]
MGLVIALAGLANVLPTYGVLPRIGPFALDWFRPLFYWLCFLSFLIWDALRQAREGRLTVFHVAAFAVALGLMSWICYDHYVIAKVLTDSVMFFSAREAWLAGITAMLSIIACWRLWGAPIAILGAVVFLYLATGPDWPGVFQTLVGDMNEFIAQNVRYDASQGILGNIMGIVLSTVLPFIILGAVLEGCGAGSSMIRISFHLDAPLPGRPGLCGDLGLGALRHRLGQRRGQRGRHRCRRDPDDPPPRLFRQFRRRRRGRGLDRRADPAADHGRRRAGHGRHRGG